MTQNFAIKYKAEVLGNVSADPVSDLFSIESEAHFSFPESLREKLIFFGGAIVFGEDIRFKPEQRTFLEDRHGYHSLELIYGLAHDKNGLREKNIAYKDQIPNGFMAIGECAGGNLVCLDKNSQIVYFWNHEAKVDEQSAFPIAHSFDAFLSKLVINCASAQSNVDGIVASGSFLDF